MENSLKESELSQAPLGKEREEGYWLYIILALMLFLALFFRFWWTNNYGGVVVDGLSMYKRWRMEKNC